MQGLKSVCTGDTLCLAGDPHPVVLDGVTLPEPVFTAALEVDSQSEQKALELALSLLVSREWEVPRSAEDLASIPQQCMESATELMDAHCMHQREPPPRTLSVQVREDPSLVVAHNSDTGQLLLSGMGELHLDIAADR
jgi:translation elongation factor EF-G